MMKLASLLGFAAMVFAIVGLWRANSLFSPNRILSAVQIAAALLMIWARLTFGTRSFHAEASPTSGGLVTSGPYRFIRHPIYASICLFLWAAVLGHPTPLSFSLGILGTAGAITRLFCEERLLVQQYPEYHAYSARTKRLVPGLW
ncbi:MAG TPA: methyltransferase [Chthoniobacterales bacterium]